METSSKESRSRNAQSASPLRKSSKEQKTREIHKKLSQKKLININRGASMEDIHFYTQETCFKLLQQRVNSIRS